MANREPRRTSFREWLSPLIWLSNNVISLVGVVLVTTAAVFWFLLLPTFLKGDAASAYTGILMFLLLPGAFMGGLALIPFGIWLQKKKGAPLNLPPLDFQNPRLRRLIAFIGVTTFANVIIGGQLTYRAVAHMESVSFCGETCHTVMAPEFAAYQNSPHSRVECVKCHIGPGANWFVKSKLSGAWQVVAVTINSYPRPIPAPVENLRPARETCETCHWPQKFGGNRVRMIAKYADDEANTLSNTVLLMRIGGGYSPGGIHGAHMANGVEMRYATRDRQRQTIPWVEVTRDGKKTVFKDADFKDEELGKLEMRVMDCMDCHNRPTHAFEMPESAVDLALAKGQMSATLPFVRKKGVELIQAKYASQEEAGRRIPAELEAYYQKEHPQAFAGRKAEIAQAGQTLTAIYKRNIFPQMNVAWGTYPNHIGHTDFPGCFRCHDGAKAAADQKTITQDCNTCHQLLAMEEKDPKVLSELGLAATGN